MCARSSDNNVKKEGEFWGSKDSTNWDNEKLTKDGGKDDTRIRMIENLVERSLDVVDVLDDIFPRIHQP
jgi:hypothetical protein